jgi:ribosomal protein L29
MTFPRCSKIKSYADCKGCSEKNCRTKREPITEKELEETLQKTLEIKDEYYRLRVRALIGLLKKFGKRRREISTLKLGENPDLTVKDDYLYVTFSISKKHKRGLFQYFKELKQTNPDSLNKPYPELVAEWKTWQETDQGHRFKSVTSTKKVSLQDKYAKLILEYVFYVKAHWPTSAYLFPSGHQVFGLKYIVDTKEHLSGRQLLRLIKPLNSRLWLHLFRELRGKEISEEHGRTLASVAEVQDFLDLENMETALRYVKRFAVSEAKKET